MPECNCTIPYYYEYFEYKIKSQKFTKLNDDDFAIKIVFDLLDKDYNIVKDNELVYSSVFENIGIDTYNVITQITQHRSIPNQMVGAKQVTGYVVVVSPFGNINTTTTTQNSRKVVTPIDKSKAKTDPVLLVPTNQVTSTLSTTSSCANQNTPCYDTSNNGLMPNETMTTKMFQRSFSTGKTNSISVTTRREEHGIVRMKEKF